MATDICARCNNPGDLELPLLLCPTCRRKYHVVCGLRNASQTAHGRNCHQCLTVLIWPSLQPAAPFAQPPSTNLRYPTAENHPRWRAPEASSNASSGFSDSKPPQPRLGEQCYSPGCYSRVQPGQKYCANHQLNSETSRTGPMLKPLDYRPAIFGRAPGDAVRTESPSLHAETNGLPRTFHTNSSPKLPSNSRLGPEFADKAAKTARKGVKDSPGVFSRFPSKRPHPESAPTQTAPSQTAPTRPAPTQSAPTQRAPPSHLNRYPPPSLWPQPEAAPNRSAPPFHLNRSTQARGPTGSESAEGRPPLASAASQGISSPRGLRLFPAVPSPTHRSVNEPKSQAFEQQKSSRADVSPSKPFRAPNATQATGRVFTTAELLKIEGKAKQWYTKQHPSPQTLAGTNGDVVGTNGYLDSKQKVTLQDDQARPTGGPRPQISRPVFEILLKHGISKGPAPRGASGQTSISTPNKKRKLDDVAGFRTRLLESFDQANFDSVFYGQEDACPPPAGVTVTERTKEPAPLGEDGKLYLHLDPRIHWPRSWTDDWYEAKMTEIKARGGKKANWGRATQRMRKRRLLEADLARREEAANKANQTPPRREPEPWAHQRPVDFGDVPDAELPDGVKNDAAWRNAAAWMRSIRQKTLERDMQVENLVARGKSVEHLLGPTGW